ncbi:MAG: lipid-binding SYLF domain-containing protein [Pseudomonadales bacterium]|nr:lipid-binding SYLF domain-containing protein [Pseudomonadales bacterium]
MKPLARNAMLMLLLICGAAVASADEYSDTVEIFKAAGESSKFFDHAYAYALFPTVGKGGMVIGGAHGKGRVFVRGRHVGNTTMNQLTVGMQLGGQAFSQVIFFEDKRALDEFTSGNFEFGAQATAVAITASASASTSTAGSSAGVSGGKKDATTVGSGYYKGMAIFTVAKGGLMYEASVGGQKFSYEAL